MINNAYFLFGDAIQADNIAFCIFRNGNDARSFLKQPGTASCDSFISLEHFRNQIMNSYNNRFLSYNTPPCIFHRVRTR